MLDPGSHIPAPWANAEEIQVDAAASPQTVEYLHAAWRSRTPLVIRWTGPLPSDNAVSSEPFYRLSVDEELPGERLRFVVTANCIDARTDQIEFDPLTRALQLGAEFSGQAADVTLRDGSEVWVDGGPMNLDLASELDLAHVPRPHLVAGTLRALQPRPKVTADLAPDQLAAVAHASGPARILAPAGSGKTRVLTERARHLVNDCGVAGRSVCLVAYNRRAKDEMKERLTDVAALEIRTLNSLALALATGSGPFRQPGDGAAPSTIDEIEARRMLDRLLPGKRRRKLTDPLEPWIDALSACRLGLRDPAEVEDAYGGDVAGFADVLDRYREELRRRNALDFDEQIVRAIERLLRDPEARHQARSVAPMILIDEFQDLTPAHLLLLRLLAGPAAEVAGVGDDDQTIYSYAGASPEWLIDFNRFFPGATDHRLTVNYRCPPEAVEAAVNLLSHNQRRVAKDIRPGPSAERSPDGLAVLSGNGTGGGPQEALVERVLRLLESGADPGNIAVLARVNAALLPAALHLNQAGVEVVRPLGLDVGMFDRSGIGAALAWIRLASAPEQGLASDDLRLALRRPPRSLHPRITDWACEQRSVSDLRRLAARLNTERDAETIASFADDIADLRKAASASSATVGELLDTIYHSIGLLGAASQLDTSQRSARRAAHADELSALAAVADLSPGLDGFEAWLRASLGAIPRFGSDQPTDGVTLATIHTTKGLEWPHVVVHDVRGDLYPHQLSTDIEEERRIFHVGITRGSSSVAVTVSGPPSPFVAEMAKPRPADQPWPTAAKGVVASRSAPTEAKKSGGAQGNAKRERAEPSGPREASLREALTVWRRERAKSDSVPAYVVLDNKALDAIAQTEPSSLIELGQIKGIGPAKLERYGDDVLGIVASIEA